MKALPVGLALLVSLALSAPDSSNCRVVGSCSISDAFGELWGIGGSGNLVCVAAAESGLYVVDVSNPANPVNVGHYHTNSEADAVAVDGNYAYVGYGSWVRVLDISDPAHPTSVGVCSATGYVVGVTKVGNYLYVCAWLSGLRVIDVSNPATPVEVGHCSTDSARTVAIAGNYAYVADQGAMRVIDISDPTNPFEVGSIATTYYTEGVAPFGGHYVCVADGIYTRIIDVGNPADPVQVAFYDQLGYNYDVHVAGNYAYMAIDRVGMLVMDVSAPASPQVAGYYNPNIGGGAAWDAIVKVGNYEYLPDLATGELKVLQFYGGGAGVEEGRQPPAYSSQLTATIVRGVLWLPAAASSETQAPSYLLDAVGRRVTRLRPGPNDVQHLSSGVYFISSPKSVERLVLTR